MRKITLLAMTVMLAALLAACAGEGEPTPTPDTIAPTISGVSASDITQTSATITWATNEPATSQVEYGLTTSYGSTMPLDSTLVTSHSVSLSGLARGTTYHYRVKSEDESGNEAVSGDYTLTTGTLPDTAPPNMSELSVSNITSSSATIAWTTDEPATSQVEYGETISYGLSTTLDESLVTNHAISVGGLTPDTTYHFRVRSADNSANEAISEDYDFTTLAYWPTEGWRTSTPEAQGMDSEILADMLETIQSGDYEIESITIIRNGYLVLDAYVHPFGPKSRHGAASCAKSVLSAVVGIAIDKGYIESVDQPVLDLFPERTVANIDANKEALTVEHLLNMSTGWDYEAQDDYMQQMWDTEDWVQHLLDLPVAEEPGTEWQYRGTPSFLLSAIISETTGMNALAFTEEHLFGPLGITDVEWRCNARGITVGYGDLHMLPQDWAKFGYLYLKEGLWEGEQVVSSDWVEVSTRQYYSTNYPPLGYGYHWWVHDPHMYLAMGSGGHYIFVLPGADMVVVVTSAVHGGPMDAPGEMLSDFIVPAIKSSTPLPENPDGVALLQSLAEALVNPQGIEHGEPASVSLRIRLTTTSSWTNFDVLYGATWAEANVISASEEATHASFSMDPASYQDNFALTQPYDRAVVGGMVELIADACLADVEQWETLVFEIRRGGIGWTRVELFSYAGEEPLLIETLECSGDTNKCYVHVPAAALMGLITFPDANLEAAIREAIGKPDGAIQGSDLEGLTSLDAGGRDITDLTGLQRCISLTQLNLNYNQVSDISPLAELSDLAFLYLSDNQIGDISPLANLTRLYYLGLTHNQISDITPVQNLTDLTFLDFGWNQVSDVSPLANLSELTYLHLPNNLVSDIQPLVANPGLSEGDTITLRGNPLSADSINVYIPQLEARGVTVEYDAP